MTDDAKETFQFSGPQEIGSRLELANRIAIAAGKLTLKHFRNEDLKVIRKGDGSPLTVADQEAETFLRDEISKAFPNDGIVGEEFGVTEGDSGFNWILDPIDGTKSCRRDFCFRWTGSLVFQKRSVTFTSARFINGRPEGCRFGNF